MGWVENAILYSAIIIIVGIVAYTIFKFGYQKGYDDAIDRWG